MGKTSLWLPVFVLLGWFTPAAAAAPANDDFANSLVVSNFNLTITASNVGATKEPGEPSHAGNAGGASVWWTWIAPTSGPVKMFTFGSTLTGGGAMDTLLAVYTGASVTNLSSVAFNNDQTDEFIQDKWSYLAFNATAGTAYRIAVDGALATNGMTGSVVLRIFANNDNFTNRVVLAGLGARSTNWNMGAGREAGELDYRPDDTPGVTNIAAKSVWWSWTAPTNTNVKISTAGSSLDSILTVFTSVSTNATFATLTQRASNNDDTNLLASTSFVTFSATSNQTYYINVDGNDFSGTGELADVGEIVLTVAADNNSFPGRIALSGTNIQARGTSLRATKQTGEPVHSPDPGDLGGASVWWTWTAPFSGFVTINTSGSDFDTVLAVYTNSSTAFNTFVLTASSDDEPSLPFDKNSQVTFLTPAGVTYQIAVDGFDGAAGNVDLNLTFLPANVPPTLAVIADRTINEDAGPQVINLTGIGPGAPDETGQTVTITAVSSDTGLLSDPIITYTNGAATGTLTFAPQTNANGAAAITITVSDTGGTANGGINTLIRSFFVTINEMNDAPTLDPIAGLTVLEDSGANDITLTGISAGGDEFQEVTITATSSSTALVPHPVIAYNSLDTEGVLTFTPASNASGTTTITVIARDDGGTAGGAKDAATNTFVIVVTTVNDPPVLTNLTNLTVNEDSGLRTVSLAGIGPGAANESQALTFAVFASDTNLLTGVAVTYVSPAATGTLRFTPVNNNFGTATVTVILSDTGGTADGGVDSTTNTFLVTVLPVNDRPTLTSASLTNRTILEDAGPQFIALSGISAGATNEASQTLTVTASSSNPALIPNPAILYTNGQSTGELSFATVTNANGTATLTVVVADDGGTANGGIAAVTNSFSVVVTAVNDPPIIDPLANFLLDESAGGQAITFFVTGIASGPPGDGAFVVNSRAVTSGNPGLVPTPSITHVTGGSTAQITFTPVVNAFGTATISVIFGDTGGTANGGINSSTNTFRVTVLPSAAASTLTVARTNNTATLSWPATISGWVPQASTNLASWSTLGGTPVNLGGRFTLTDTIGSNGKFYRLTKP
ncbi:MAG: PPC domain-containing protein [Verrucomicrobia bacterium]|nr:PPC domain-containing protein [Verrucomicrobiota bacterium]